MYEDLTPALGKTEEEGVSEKVSTKSLENEIHVVTLLLERAPWDLAVEAFLVRVFLCLPRHLKACKRVCSSWNSFINEQVWGRPNIQRRLRRYLAKNWSLGVPIRQFEFQPTAASCLACDEELLVVGGAGEVAVYSLLPVRHIGNLDLRAESGEEEELRLAVAPDFFVTVQTTTRKLQVWSKACSLLDSVDIWDVSVRCVVARGDNVLVAGLPTIDIVSCLDHEGQAGGGWMFGSRAVVLVFHMDERLAHRFTVTLEPELGSVRAIDWETGGQVFLSGQDRHLVVWSLENGAEERRIATGLVVALVVTEGLAITAGSLQNLGVRVWNFDSGELLAVHGDTAYYESLVLSGGRQIFARGLLCERIVLPLPKAGPENDEFALESQRWLTFSPLMAANITKLVVIQGVSSVQVAEGLDSLSLDLIRTKRRPKVSIKDFWSKS